MAGFAENWKLLSGIEGDWKGLLDPIDNDLRRYLIHYGQRVSAVGDAFNNVEESTGRSYPRFPPDQLFDGVGLVKDNPYTYDISSYFFARSTREIFNWVIHGESAWFGYVAVSTDTATKLLGRRDILVAWRGTAMEIELFKDFEVFMTPATDLFPQSNAKVEHGFHSVYTTFDEGSIYNKKSARDQILAEVKKLVDKYANEKVSITVAGHSLGAALATLTAMDIAYNGYNKPTGSETAFPVTAFPFASPLVGDRGFIDVYSKLSHCHILRIRNAGDLVPTVPWQICGYKEVGVELFVDTTTSPYLKQKCFLMQHDLNIYMHGIAGYKGNQSNFEIVVKFDNTTVNKYHDALKDIFNVPANWWSTQNSIYMVQGMYMIQDDKGAWKLYDYVPDVPTEDETSPTSVLSRLALLVVK